MGSVSGTDVFRFAPCAGPCCEVSPTCDVCESTPEQWKVVLSLITEGTCGNCNSINGTYVLTRYPKATWPGCEWRYTFPSTVCTISYINIRIGAPAGTRRIWVELYPAGVYVLAFRQTYGNIVDCESLVDENIPLFFSFGWPCSGGSAVCLLTAL